MQWCWSYTSVSQNGVKNSIYLLHPLVIASQTMTHCDPSEAYAEHRCYTQLGAALSGFLLINSLWLGVLSFWIQKKQCKCGQPCVQMHSSGGCCKVTVCFHNTANDPRKYDLFKAMQKSLWVTVCVEQWMENSQWSLHGSLASFLWLNCRSGHLCWSVSHRSP